MGSSRTAFRAFGVFFLAALAVFLAPARAGELVGVRFGVTSPTETRIVFDLSSAVPYSISGDLEGQGRLIVEFQGLKAAAVERGAGAGHVAAYRIAPGADGRTTAVLGFGRTARLKGTQVLPAAKPGDRTRLVIDVVASDKAGLEASLPKKFETIKDVIQAATAPQRVASEPLAEEDWPVIVIDPGHGGGDPGAVGPAGTLEKTVTLAAAQQLADYLRARGKYRIVMTRAGDQRLVLEERMKVARDARADLFISIHADAHGDPKVRGGSVYTLSEAGSQRSTREALSNGNYNVYGQDLKEARPDVQGILLDLTQNYTDGRSAKFAELLIRKLVTATPLVNNSHRTADLKVLLSPDVAAVLLELAFISNREDEKNLTSKAWREKTMTAVAEAIDQYFATRPATVRQAARGPEGAL